MPSGKVHATANLVMLGAAAPVAVGAVVAGAPWPLVAAVYAGMVAGTLITPDIDHHAITHEERRMLRVAWPLGVVWLLYWWPYGRLFQHRGKRITELRRSSHVIIVGTATRMVYAAALPVGWGLWRYGAASVWALLVAVWPLIAALGAGWAMMDALHIAMDAMPRWVWQQRRR